MQSISTGSKSPNFLKREYSVTTFLLCTLLVSGLLSQALKGSSAHLYFLFAIVVLVVILAVEQMRMQLSKIQLLFVGFMVLSTVLLPMVFSRLPVASMSFGFAVAFGVLVMFVITTERAMALLYCVVVVALMDGAYSVFELMGGTTRPRGLFADWQLRALYSWVAVLFLFTQLPKFQSKLTVNGSWILIALLLLNLHTAQSRTLQALSITALILIGFFAITQNRQLVARYLTLVSLFVMTFALYWLITTSLDQPSVRGLQDVSHLNGRIPQYLSAWHYIKDYPIFGFGAGLWMYMYPSVQMEFGSAGLNVHNDYIEYLATTGIVGTFPLVLVAVYFAVRVYKALISGQTNNLIFSGLLLSIMLYVLLNFFFWRIENFIIFAALWRLMECDVQAEAHSIPIKRIQKLIVVGILLVPAVTLTARVYETYYVKLHEGRVFDDLHVWSDIVLDNESSLNPMRASVLASIIDNDEIDLLPGDIIDEVKDQLDRSIAAKTIYAGLYCARAHLALTTDESLDLAVELSSQGIYWNPSDSYCQGVHLAIRIKQGDVYNALSDLKIYFSSPRIRQQSPNSLNTLAQSAAYYAFQSGEPVFAKYFSQLNFSR